MCVIRLDGASPGARLRGLRLARGWTQSELAQQLGWRASSGSLIARFESNDRHPSPDMKVALARLLGADPWKAPTPTLTDAQFEKLMAVIAAQGGATQAVA